MKNIKFNPFKYLFLIFLCLTLSACSGGLNAGLEAYQSPDGRYAFLYPTGWTRVKVDGGPEIIYHDLINSNETLSLVISDVKLKHFLQRPTLLCASNRAFEKSLIVLSGCFKINRANRCAVLGPIPGNFSK